MTWTAFNSVAPMGSAEALSDMAGYNLRTLIAHPFVPGLGEGSGNFKYLSFPNAVDVLSKELLTETQAVFGVAVTANNYAGFAGAVNNLTTVFPIKQFNQVGKRALKLSTLTDDKFNLPSAPGLLSGGMMALKSLPMIAALQKAAIMEHALAVAGMFDSTDPLSNLTAFQSEKTVSDSAINAALSSVKSAVVGASGYRFYAESDAAALIKNGLGSEHTLTAIMLFIGTPSELLLFREIAP